MIGYYVHHVGDGHLTRACAIARSLDEPVCGLSSRSRPEDWPGEWLQLARDDHGSPDDPTAGGALHWAPLGNEGLRERMAQLSAWVATRAPRLVVVDVSVEVALLVRSMGVPTVVMALPGTRADAAHQLGYQVASAILAPWPDWADLLHGGEPWRAKTHPVGAISRFEGRASAPGAGGRDEAARPAARDRSDGEPAAGPGGRDEPVHPAAAIRGGDAPPPDSRDHEAAAHGPAEDLPLGGGGAVPRAGARRVLVLSGRGGTELTVEQLVKARAETPGWEWDVLGPPGDRWVADPWPLLCAADVVVTHAGQNAIADVAAARRPAVIVPQPRPHDEQVTTARTLGAAGLAIVREQWPAGEWAEVLERAVALGGEQWSRWSAPGAASRAATVLRELECAPR